MKSLSHDALSRIGPFAAHTTNTVIRESFDNLVTLIGLVNPRIIETNNNIFCITPIEYEGIIYDRLEVIKSRVKHHVAAEAIYGPSQIASDQLYVMNAANSHIPSYIFEELPCEEFDMIYDYVRSA